MISHRSFIPFIFQFRTNVSYCLRQCVCVRVYACLTTQSECNNSYFSAENFLGKKRQEDGIPKGDTNKNTTKIEKKEYW